MSQRQPYPGMEVAYTPLDKQVAQSQSQAPIPYDPSLDYRGHPSAVHHDPKEPGYYGSYRDQPGNDDPLPTTPVAGRTICGIPKKKFIIIMLVVVITNLVILGAVLGGVAAAITKPKADRAGNTPSPTSSSNSTVPTTTTANAPAFSTSAGMVLGDATCDSTVNQQTYQPDPNSADKYMQLCGINWSQGVRAASIYNDDQVYDIAVAVKPSMKACIDFCAEFNNLYQATKCQAVVYQANLTKAFNDGVSGNCWLKNARGSVDDRNAWTNGAYLVRN